MFDFDRNIVEPLFEEVELFINTIRAELNDPTKH
jgi:hypothetical protein